MKYSELLFSLQNLIKRNVTQTEIANVLSESVQTINKRAKRNSNFSNEELDKIEAYFNISLKNYVDIVDNSINETIISTYYPDVFGSCGNGLFVPSECCEPISIPKKFFTRYCENEKYSVVNAQGDSMEPFICNLDKLIVRHIENEQIKDNSVYIFCYKESIYVKRLAQNIDQIIIKSDNKEYQTRILEGDKLNDLIIIGEVIGVFRDLRG